MEQGIRIRTIILLWLLLSGVSSIYAQNYIPFPTTNATWCDGYYFWNGWLTDTSYNYYKTSGSTTINDTTYTIISSENNDQYGYLREADQRVYFRYNEEINEFLLYDFSLNVGDTVYLPLANYQSITFEMGEAWWVDSVLVGTKYHRRIHIMSGWIEVAFIAGIGSDNGLLYCEIPWVDWYGFLDCFSQNDSIYSINGSGSVTIGNCWETLKIDEYNTPIIQIYPNPFTSTTTIEYELTEPSHVQLTIYNAIGKDVYKAEDRLMAVGKHSFTWSADRIPEGLYYAVLRSGEGVSVVKMVKQ